MAREKDGPGSADQAADSIISEGWWVPLYLPKETQVPALTEDSCLEEKLKGIVRKHFKKKREWPKRWTRAKLRSSETRTEGYIKRREGEKEKEFHSNF